MGISDKFKMKKEFGPKDRTEACSKELTELMEKYKCVIDIQHRIVIMPLEINNEVANTDKN